MKDLVVKVRPVTEEALGELEKRGLLRRFVPTPGALNAAAGGVKVDRVYTTDPRYGSHMLICVGFNRSRVSLGVHPDAEDFLLVNKGRQQKPLVLIVALHSQPEFERRALSGVLDVADLWALEMAFNDPRLSFFTMNGGTPHCEWTTAEPGPASVFFVTEPSLMRNLPVALGEYSLNVEY